MIRRSASSLRRFPLTVWLVVALQAMLMVGFMILYPPFQQSDESAHVDYVLAHRQGQWFDGPGQRPYQAGVIAAVGQVPSIQFQVEIGTLPVLPRGARQSFDALGTGPSDSIFTDQMVQHPPLYYGLAAGFSYLLPNFSHHRYDIQVFWLRVLSLLLLLPVPLLIYSTALRMTNNPATGLSAAVLPLTIPSYLRTGSAVTNDSLLVLLTTVLIALLARVALGDLGRRLAVFVGLVWGAALLTKGFALALPPAIVLAYLVGAQGGVWTRVRGAWRGLLTAGVVGTAVGGWWWVRNVVVYGTVQPDGYGKLTDAVRQFAFGPDRPGGNDVGFFKGFFPLLSQRMWGSLGLLDVPSLPIGVLDTLCGVLLLALIVSVVVGIGRFAGQRRRAGLADWTVGRAVVLVLPLLLIMGVMYVGSRSTYLDGGQLTGIQVRYLEPALLGMVIAASVSIHVLAGRFSRWVPVGIGAGGLVLLGASVYKVLSIEMSKGDPHRIRRIKQGIRFVVEQGPFPAAVTGVLMTVALATALATAVALVRFALLADRLDSLDPAEPRYSG